MRAKEERKKASLKLNIKKTKIMASSPIPSWQREGEEVEAVTDFLFLGSKITVDGDCSHEIKRLLFFGRKAMTNLESPLDYKEVKSVNPKGNQPLIFTGRPDAEAEAPILWPTDVKCQLIGKDADAGKD